MRRALLELPGVELAVIAPDSNRSATARAITTRQPLWVEEVEFGDGTSGFATDGTPVDCVRFAALGLIEFEPELIVSGINHGANLGDDITYSGTVAAALEGIVLGLPAIAVSQQADRGELDFRARRARRLRAGRGVRRRGWSRSSSDVPMPRGHAPERELPGRRGRGRARVPARQAHLQRPAWSSTEEEDGRRRYRIYGEEPGYQHEDGTDFAAIADGLHRRDPAPLRPDRPGRRRGARRLRPRRACCDPAARGS